MHELKAITARDPDIVAAEINTIKRKTQQIMIAGALEIGGKLVEAKGMVPHGQWGAWLKEKVNYSQSTANNMMKLYQEYGGNQQSFFDSWTNSQTFAELDYTHHLALMALPFSERQDFAETHQVAEMSTRELEKRIRAKLSGQFAEQLAAAEQRAADAVKDRDSAQSAARDANTEAGDYLRQKQAAEQALQKAVTEKTNAEKSEQTALSLVDKLNGQLAEAQKKAQAAEDALKKAQENPDIPEAVMATLRQEAEKDVAKKAAGDLQNQLDSARQALQKAEQEKTAAEDAARVAAGKLEEVQKASKLADPNMMAIQTLAESMMATWNTIQGHRMKAVASDPANAAPLQGFLTQMLETMRAGLGEQ